MTLTAARRTRVRISPEAEVLPPRPLKKPRQARSRFTVQAVFDAFVRIWRQGGWAAVSTRSVAAEAGYAVGTLYEYFPNRDALLSGYVRHCLEALHAQLETQVVAPDDLPPAERLARLVRLTLERPGPERPWYDRAMLLLEHRVATLSDHRRSFGELTAIWCAALTRLGAATADPATVAAWLLPQWGARRYAWLLDLDGTAEARWIAEAQIQAARAFLAPEHVQLSPLPARRSR